MFAKRSSCYSCVSILLGRIGCLHCVGNVCINGCCLLIIVFLGGIGRHRRRRLRGAEGQMRMAAMRMMEGLSCCHCVRSIIFVRAIIFCKNTQKIRISTSLPTNSCPPLFPAPPKKSPGRKPAEAFAPKRERVGKEIISPASRLTGYPANSTLHSPNLSLRRRHRFGCRRGRCRFGWWWR